MAERMPTEEIAQKLSGINYQINQVSRGVRRMYKGE
jgi:hypothetical protein